MGGVQGENTPPQSITHSNGGGPGARPPMVNGPLLWGGDLNLQKVDLRREATLFVVDDIVKPGNRILWVAGLTGGCITRPDRDQWLVYKRALGWQRFVWLSPGFKRASPASAHIIQSLVRHASVPRRWRLLADHAEVQRLCGTKPGCQMLGLVLPSERGDLIPNRRLYNEKAALRLVASRGGEKSKI